MVISPKPDPGYYSWRPFWWILGICITIFFLAWTLRLPGGPWEPRQDPSPTPIISITPSRS